MTDPLVRQINRFDAEADAGPERLFWGRVGLDGLPFRGRRAPDWTDEEFEARVVEVRRVRNGTFDIDDPESNRNFLNVLEGQAQGWFLVLKRYDHFDWQAGVKRVYLEWVERYLQDGTPVPIDERMEARYESSDLRRDPRYAGPPA